MKKENNKGGSKTPKIIDGGLTQGEIDMLKKQTKDGYLRLVTVKDKAGNEEHFWFKKPDMTTISAFTKFVEADPIKATVILFNDCLLKGRKEACDEPEVMMAINEHILTLIQAHEAEVKEY